jgi:DNA-3-methyladenine glycosylase
MKVPRTYFQSDDVVFLARDLIGKSIFTRIGEHLTGGVITETEAYAGITDRASHAYGERRTSRTEVMYQSGGVSYVYLCYGIHFLFNIVTGKKNNPHAILIRGIYPDTGLEQIRERRKNVAFQQLANGPGKVCQSLGISRKHNALPLDGDIIWLEDRGRILREEDISIGKRIGVDYAAEDALLPWRFFVDIKKAPRLFEAL